MTGTGFRRRRCCGLRRYGFSPQRPARRAYQQKPEKVRAWLEGEYPAIVARPQRERRGGLDRSVRAAQRHHTTGSQLGTEGQHRWCGSTANACA
ncbi:winged helix-turn-helix domain-containing protein [Nocardia terpenica]|uniref:Winged helix-turn helix domain-containing protein n=1 Tax=Nocardia terpenica TaxID=455432 RepID=A0A6G9ZDC9_9NOCA|nr:winged helix-turn-helix domain-containing protein [Nocardia terpenica]QIS23512.1 hypothetical protein F6W96_39680 [Nocardia terpenica]